MIEDRIKSLTSRFDKELLRIGENTHNFKYMCVSLSKIDFIDCDVEILSDKIKFHLVLSDNVITMITKSFDSDLNEVIFSYFINRKLVVSNICDVENVINFLNI